MYPRGGGEKGRDTCDHDHDLVQKVVEGEISYQLS